MGLTDLYCKSCSFLIIKFARASGLDVRRYDAPTMSAELREEFEFLEEHRETHVTQGGGEQRFVYFLYRRSA